MNAPTLATTASKLVTADFLPSLSVDCVIFGFHDNQLKVLLLETSYDHYWRLVGGFVSKQENVDAAANSMLRERTGLSDIFLRQFHLFGDVERTP